MSIQIFDVSGVGIRFGVTEDGTPYAVASDFAKTMGYRDAANALRLLDADEKGTQIVSTSESNGRVAKRPVSVVFEDGMWELIFRSTLPGAKAIKTRVKAILREIRETGRYEAQPPAPLSNRDLALMVIAEADRAEAAEQRAAALEPSAKAWDTLADATGDYSLRDAALILNRDPNITTGQNRLLATLRDLGMVDRRGTPYARHADHLRERPTSYRHPHSGEPTLGRPQIRVTVRGLRYLHGRMGGVAPLRFEQVAFDHAG